MDKDQHLSVCKVQIGIPLQDAQNAVRAAYIPIKFHVCLGIHLRHGLGPEQQRRFQHQVRFGGKVAVYAAVGDICQLSNIRYLCRLDPFLNKATERLPDDPLLIGVPSGTFFEGCLLIHFSHL